MAPKVSANVKQAANEAIPDWTFVELNGLFPWCLQSLQICLESLARFSESAEARLLKWPIFHNIVLGFSHHSPDYYKLDGMIFQKINIPSALHTARGSKHLAAPTQT